MHRRIIKSLFFVICCAIILIETANAKYGYSVLIISSEQSRFKDPVISRVIKSLKKEGYRITLSTQKELGNKTAKKYNAVVIINNVYKGQKNRSVRVFIDENEQRKIVLFNVVGSEYWRSADKSRTDKSYELAQSLIEKIKIVIGL
ncbi:MAG: hypothetical protein A2474_05700 [Elusimicrobia bacterium RIFOXYC2_FULL_34_12]|nr:MAG: hypothetical protein A2474_05700 [Elusimicrobia bacterium RIFOXYC2_FULL_34_12]OGS38754.1 MAG: hypothetical protein A2551_00960 [Elusimicrobia bacterium RIFOXYD2_FULL_34_30]HAM38963.1 hypothetical protein [Elusimicrobiota bacterium]